VAKKKKPTKTAEVVEIVDVEIEEIPSDDAETIEIDTPADDVTDDTVDPVVDDVDMAETQVAPEQSKASVLPLILGGAAAAFLGFAAARSNVIDNFLPPSWRMNAAEVALQEQVNSAQSQIATLDEKLAALSTEFAEQPVGGSDDATLVAQIEGLLERIDELEKRPAGSTVEAPDFSNDFAQLREIAEKQQDEINTLLADARLAEQTSQDAASQTLARAAASRIIAAIESGAPFAAALDDLAATGATEVPSDLSSVAKDGVVTLASLQSDIPAAARAALAASPTDSNAGLGGFLKRQLGARSVEPREGGDTDAILSRVEAAVRQGHLTDALAEADTLPPESKSAMADWLENAENRLAVTTASEALMQRLAAN
jgi:hypothetical protein